MLSCARRCFNCLFTCEQGTNVFLRILGPLYVAIASTLIITVGYLYYSVVLPLRHPLLSAEGIVHATIEFVLIFNVVFNHMHCVFTDPGLPPPVLKPETLVDQEILERYARWCKKCKKPKAMFTHHCQICGRCVTRMDHHCPWMANCVGHYNYRYFFNFLAWLWSFALYTTVMTWPYNKDLTANKDGERMEVVFSFAIAGGTWLAISLLWGWHVYLVLTAQTTIDYYKNLREKKRAQARGDVWVNMFDLGPKLNWQETFDERGRFWWVQWALPRRRPHSTTGLFTPTVHTIEEHRERLLGGGGFADSSEPDSRNLRRGATAGSASGRSGPEEVELAERV